MLKETTIAADVERHNDIAKFLHRNGRVTGVIIPGFHITSNEGKKVYLDKHYRGGDLLDAIDEKKLTDVQKNQAFMHVCEGVATMHKEQIYHRDIKPRNILLSNADGKERYDVSDLGWAVSKKNINEILDSNIAPLEKHKKILSSYSLSYISKNDEGKILGLILKHNKTTDNTEEIVSLLEKLDVTALGMTMYELYTNSKEEETVDGVLNSGRDIIYQKLRSSGCPEGIAMLICSMLSLDPAARPSMEKVVLLTNQIFETDPAKKLSINDLQKTLWPAEKNATYPPRRPMPPPPASASHPPRRPPPPPPASTSYPII